MHKFATQSIWVLHSPYPDGTWRGIEKCMTLENCESPRSFASEELARSFCLEHELIDMTPVRCLLLTPGVRQSFGSVPERIDGTYGAFKEEDVEFSISVTDDWSEISGMFATGDNDMDLSIERRIAEAREESQWAWCIVTVTARWQGLEGSDALGAVSILPEDADGPEVYFRESYGYYEDMKSEALEDLKSKIASSWSFT